MSLLLLKKLFVVRTSLIVGFRGPNVIQKKFDFLTFLFHFCPDLFLEVPPNLPIRNIACRLLLLPFYVFY